MRRCGTSKINKRVVRALIKSGAFDCFGETRKSLMDSYPDSIKMADQKFKKYSTRTGRHLWISGRNY